jgi:plastocyanin
VPVVVRALVFADVVFFMAPAAVTNLVGREQLGAILSPLALAVTSAIGLVATAGYLLQGGGGDGGRVLPTITALAAVAVAVVGSAAALLVGPAGLRPPGANSLTVATHGAKFSTTELTATAGTITIEATNDDLFWHTFTIDRLGVDLRMPVKAHRSASFTAPPGTYSFRCAIPGHESIGMKGTLTVR